MLHCSARWVPRTPTDRPTPPRHGRAAASNRTAASMRGFDSMIAQVQTFLTASARQKVSSSTSTPNRTPSL